MNIVGEDAIPLDKMRSMNRAELEGLIFKGLLQGPEAFDVYLEVSAKEAESRGKELEQLGVEMGLSPDQARTNKYYGIFLKTLVSDKSEEGTKLKVGLIQDRVETLNRIKNKLGSEHSSELESVELECDAWINLERSLLPKKE